MKEDGDSDKRGWFANLLSGPGSTVALAFLCNKALLPVRVPITVGLTPAVARWAGTFPASSILCRRAPVASQGASCRLLLPDELGPGLLRRSDHCC